MLALLCRLMFLASVALATASSVLLGLHSPGWVMVAGLVAYWKRGRLAWDGFAHGTARIAGLHDLGGMLGYDGLILGTLGPVARPSRRAGVAALASPFTSSVMACWLFLAAWFGTRQLSRRFIRVKDYVHLATFAPTGKGKGVSVLTPNLLSYPRSVVTVDPDGELFKLTGEHRLKKFRARNIVLAPFGVPGVRDLTPDTLNPLDFIDAARVDFLDACQDLAASFVVRTGHDGEASHFLDMAEVVLTGLIAFICACEHDPAKRNLQTLRVLTSSREKFRTAIAAMIRVEGFGGVIQRYGGMLGWLVSRELGSVMTTIQRFTRFLDSPAVAASTARSSFKPGWLKSGTASLWMCLPADQLTRLAPVQRMWMTVILRQLTKDGADEKAQVLFLIDEAANIGHIQALEDAVTQMRKRGIRLWFFFQSIQQVKDCFCERAGTFLDNIDTQQFFGINAFESADAISKRVGDMTMLIESINDTNGDSRSYGPGTGESGSWSRSRSVTVSEHGRRVYRPEEILVLPEDLALVFHRSKPVIAAGLPRYYQAKEFRRGGTGRQPVLGLGTLPFAAGLLLACLLGLGVTLITTVPPNADIRRLPAMRALTAAAEPVARRIASAMPAVPRPVIQPATVRPGVPAAMPPYPAPGWASGGTPPLPASGFGPGFNRTPPQGGNMPGPRFGPGINRIPPQGGLGGFPPGRVFRPGGGPFFDERGFYGGRSGD